MCEHGRGGVEDSSLINAASSWFSLQNPGLPASPYGQLVHPKPCCGATHPVLTKAPMLRPPTLNSASALSKNGGQLRKAKLRASLFLIWLLYFSRLCPRRMAQRSCTKKAMLINNFQPCVLVKGSEALGSVPWEPESSYEALRIYWFTHPLNIDCFLRLSTVLVPDVQYSAKLTQASRTSHKRKNLIVK